MPPKKSNDLFDLSEFDDLLDRSASSGKQMDDFAGPELDDYQITIPEPPAAEEKGKGEARDDEDLDSFLMFYGKRSSEPSEPPADEAEAGQAEAAVPPETPEEETAQTVPEPAQEPEYPAAEADPPADAEQLPEEDELPPEENEGDNAPRGGLFARFLRRWESGDDGEESDAAEPDGEEEPEDEPERDGEEFAEDRPRFSLRSLFARPTADGEEDGDDESSEEDPDREEYDGGEEVEPEENARFSLASLFRRRDSLPEDESGDEPQEQQEEPEQEEAGAAGERISFFTMLSPEKEKFLRAMHGKKKHEPEPAEILPEEAEPEAEAADEEPTVREQTALRTVAAAELTTEEDIRRLPRKPRVGEMLVYDSELDEIDYIDEEDLPELRDYMPVRFSRHSRSGIGGGIMYALFVICISVVLACAGWLFASDVLALNKPDTTAIVTILPYVPTEEDTLNEDGDAVDEEGRVINVDVDQVASALKSAGVIDFKWLFKIFTQLSSADVKIDPGSYDVSAKLDYRALVTEMQTGSDSQEITRITFPEGYTMDQIFQLLEDNGICDKDDLYETAANYDFGYDWLEGIPLGEASRLEGYLFPDTYDFYQGESAVNAINRFLLRFHYILTMDMYTQAENLGITIHEAVIIASLIEEEAGAEDNRAYFASVIYNRLDAGWKLQLDSTVNYVMGTSTLDISIANTEIDHPYNTYVYEGLPPGPISNPGKASLEAALNPASTNYWFWYAYEGKTTFFSNSSDFNEFAYSHPIS